MVGLTSEDLQSELSRLPNVTQVDFLGDLNYGNLSVPDDYDGNTGMISPSLSGYGLNTYAPVSHFKHLDLVNARQAWNITTGNNNISIGMVDGPFDINHPDLINKITAHYGDIHNGSAPYPHGTKMAGAAAAETDNNIGISSIGYNTALVTMQVYNNQFTPTNPHPFQNASTITQQMLYVVQNNPQVKVLTHSRKEGCNYIDANALVYQEIWEQYGVTTITAGGNGNWKTSCNGASGQNEYLYPASYDHVISVSTVGHHSDHGYVDPQGYQIGWKDVHEYIVGDDNFTFTHNDKIDIVAPGYFIPTTTRANEYETGNGTSFSGPFVCGVAALMYDVNPTITPDQVKQILMDTAVDIYQIPENAPYIGLLGAGRVNAYAAVLQAKCLYNPTSELDLTIRNTEDDKGAEPDVDSGPVLWNSPDIWVRNQPDGKLVQVHENPEYNTNSSVYIYVKVTNKSCETLDISDNAKLKVHWAKANTALGWPDLWDGSTDDNGSLLLGDEINPISEKTIPSLNPGESTIIEFEWQPPNPNNYTGLDNPWHFCILARIISDDDPMAFDEDLGLNNVYRNNNIASKNLSLVDINQITGMNPGATILVGNPVKELPELTEIEFSAPKNDPHPIHNEAEVYVTLDDAVWNLWVDGGSQGSGLKIANEEDKKLLINDSPASIKNLNFPGGEWGKISMSFNFLTEEPTHKLTYLYHVRQIESATSKTTGTESYEIKPNNKRPFFKAESNESNNSSLLEATTINETAVYNWYDVDGNLLHTGEQLALNSNIAQEYKLEIIAEADGYKDYAFIAVESPYALQSLSPNPANNQVQVAYQTQGATSAYLSITSTQTAVSNNYILNVSNNNLNIDVSSYPAGTYVIALSCDGEIIETKNLIIQ
ncbi:MAG: S8 family serine peptidase [Mesonia sp.]|uniref:S8 family serine peptidase n=1 Tax=Mesonia sp. TaxID=1960830 RepID=UPI003F947144